MRSWRLRLTLLIVPLALVCFGLGIWQSLRMQHKQQLVAQFEQLQEQAPVPALGATQRQRFTPIFAEGFFRPELSFLLDNRVYAGRAGYEVYSYFQAAPANSNFDGIWVNRGWVEHQYPRQARPQPAPETLVRIEGIADLPELWSAGIQLGSDALPAFVSTVELAAFDAIAGVNTPEYALKQAKAQPGALQRLADHPFSIAPERHLGYALQWFALALVLVIGCYFCVRKRPEPRA